MKKVLILIVCFTPMTTGLLAHAEAVNIRSMGAKYGHESYAIQCDHGADYVIYKKDDGWYGWGSGYMGSRFNEWAPQRLAKFLCDFDTQTIRVAKS